MSLGSLHQWGIHMPRLTGAAQNLSGRIKTVSLHTCNLVWGPFHKPLLPWLASTWDARLHQSGWNGRIGEEISQSCNLESTGYQQEALKSASDRRSAEWGVSRGCVLSLSHFLFKFSPWIRHKRACDPFPLEEGVKAANNGRGSWENRAGDSVWKCDLDGKCVTISALSKGHEERLFLNTTVKKLHLSYRQEKSSWRAFKEKGLLF